MVPPLEDFCEDIIGKAQRGLNLDDASLAAQAGITLKDLIQIKAGALHEEAIARLAPCLNLSPDRLLVSARKSWSPKPRSIQGLLCFTTPYSDMMVNAYLVWDPNSPNRSGAVFDTGANATALIKTIDDHDLSIRHIFLTHTHGDHIADLDRLITRTNAPVHVSQEEALPQSQPITEGDLFSIQGLTIETRLTSGHSVGGITYVISGLDSPVAIVGDALFAGSMGGGKISHAQALENNRKKILTLPNETVLCPGHGPLTTVGEEKEHNPFFPEFQET